MITVYGAPTPMACRGNKNPSCQSPSLRQGDTISSVLFGASSLKNRNPGIIALLLFFKATQLSESIIDHRLVVGTCFISLHVQQTSFSPQRYISRVSLPCVFFLEDAPTLDEGSVGLRSAGSRRRPASRKSPLSRIHKEARG